MKAQNEEVFFRDVKFLEAEAAIRDILAEVDAGRYDQELNESGVHRDPGVSLADHTTFEQPRGLGPNEWYVIMAIITPAVTYGSKTIWDKIVIPKLKRKFRVDQVSRHNPKKRTR